MADNDTNQKRPNLSTAQLAMINAVVANIVKLPYNLDNSEKSPRPAILAALGELQPNSLYTPKTTDEPTISV